MTRTPNRPTLDADDSHLTERVLRELREQIVSGQLPPGSKLPIRDLAARLGSSPIPVREALRALHAQGLVDLSTYRVAVVAPVSVEDLDSIYVMRANLEALATRQAAARGDAAWLSRVEEALHSLEALYATGGPDLEWEDLDAAHKRFHHAIYVASGSKWLLQCIALLRDASDRYHRLFGPAQNMLRGGLEDHQQIVHWLAEGETELASILVRRHVERTGSTLRRILVSQLAPDEAAGPRGRNGRVAVALEKAPSSNSRPKRAERQSPLRALNTRELAALSALAQGKSDAAISAALEWPLFRVQRTLESIFDKLGLADSGDVDRRVVAALIYLREQSPGTGVRQ